MGILTAYVDDLAMIERTDEQLLIPPAVFFDIFVYQFHHRKRRAFRFELDKKAATLIHEIKDIMQRGDFFAFPGIECP